MKLVVWFYNCTTFLYRSVEKSIQCDSETLHLIHNPTKEYRIKKKQFLQKVHNDNIDAKYNLNKFAGFCVAESIYLSPYICYLYLLGKVI